LELFNKFVVCGKGFFCENRPISETQKGAI